MKVSGTARSHGTSVNGFGWNNDIKTEQMIKTIEDLSIDMIMLSETNYKCNTRKIDKTRNKFMRTSKDVIISTSDRKDHELTQNDYLPSGTLITVFRKLFSCAVQTSKASGKLGKIWEHS